MARFKSPDEVGKLDDLLIKEINDSLNDGLRIVFNGGERPQYPRDNTIYVKKIGSSGLEQLVEELESAGWSVDLTSEDYDTFAIIRVTNE